MRELTMDEMDVVSGGTDWWVVLDAAIAEGFQNGFAGAGAGAIGGAFVGAFVPSAGVTIFGGAVLGTVGGGATGFIEGFLSGGYGEWQNQSNQDWTNGDWGHTSHFIFHGPSEPQLGGGFGGGFGGGWGGGWGGSFGGGGLLWSEHSQDG